MANQQLDLVALNSLLGSYKTSTDSNYDAMVKSINAMLSALPVIPPVVPPVIPPVIPPIIPPIGAFPSTGTASGVINYSGKSGITISGLSINAGGGSNPCITLTNCNNIHITQNVLQNSKQVGIYLVNCYNIQIDWNSFTSLSTGVYATNSTGGGIVADNNHFLNMVGPLPRGQFVQFNNVSGAGLSISNNRGINILGAASYPEDAINLFQSNGTAASPIQVVGNWILGGGPSSTGGGIMLGDYGGSFQYAANNILVNPGQYGIAITGGDSNSIVNNKVFAMKQSFTNVGIYVWNNNISGLTISNPTVSGNHVNYINAAGSSNGSWVGTGGSPTGWATNNFNDTSITAAILPSTF